MTFIFPSLIFFTALYLLLSVSLSVPSLCLLVFICIFVSSITVTHYSSYFLYFSYFSSFSLPLSPLVFTIIISFFFFTYSFHSLIPIFPSLLQASWGCQLNYKKSFQDNHVPTATKLTSRETSRRNRRKVNSLNLLINRKNWMIYIKPLHFIIRNIIIPALIFILFFTRSH